MTTLPCCGDPNDKYCTRVSGNQRDCVPLRRAATYIEYDAMMHMSYPLKLIAGWLCPPLELSFTFGI